jgi:hypothetical protein
MIDDEVGAGGAVSLTPQANKEEMVFILHGRCVAHIGQLATDARAGSALEARARRCRSVRGERTAPCELKEWTVMKAPGIARQFF